MNENNIGESGDRTLMMIVVGGGLMCLVISTVFVCFWGYVCGTHCELRVVLFYLSLYGSADPFRGQSLVTYCDLNVLFKE